MPSMTAYRNADLNLNFKVQEILEDNDIPAGKYRVMDGYPNELDLTTGEIWPTIAVELDNLFGRDVELGSKQWPACQFSLDIFANSDSQRDDITYILFDNLNEATFRFYDFNTGFPPSVGDYTGVTSVGDWYLDSLTTNVLYPESDTHIKGLKHHIMIDGILYIPDL